MPILSLAHLTVLEAHPLELIDLAAEAGFDAIGLRIVAPLPGDTIVPVIGDLPLQRQIKARSKDAGVQILDVEAVWLMPDTDINALAPALELGADLGASSILVVGHDPDRSRLIDNFSRLCELSSGSGLRPMLEFIPYSQVRSLADAYAILQAAQATNAGLLVDAIHLSRSGGSPADLAGYPSELFSYIHLCDVPAALPKPEDLRREARGERLYPGDGGLWLEDFIAAFPSGAPIAIEAPASHYGHLSLADRAKLAANKARQVIKRAGR
jgi:sugar phosphate isomerase/epimerase